MYYACYLISAFFRREKKSSHDNSADRGKNVYDPPHPCMSGWQHHSGPKRLFIYIILPRSPVFDDSLHADEITPFNYYWTETNVPTVDSLSNEKEMCPHVECPLVFQMTFCQRQGSVERYIYYRVSENADNRLSAWVIYRLKRKIS